MSDGALNEQGPKCKPTPQIRRCLVRQKLRHMGANALQCPLLQVSKPMEVDLSGKIVPRE